MTTAVLYKVGIRWFIVTMEEALDFALSGDLEKCKKSLERLPLELTRKELDIIRDNVYIQNIFKEVYGDAWNSSFLNPKLFCLTEHGCIILEHGCYQRLSKDSFVKSVEAS